MPTTANVIYLIRFLGHQSNLGVLGVRLEKTINVDLTKLFRECNVIHFRNLLVSDKYQAMLKEGFFDAIHFLYRESR